MRNECSARSCGRSRYRAPVTLPLVLLVEPDPARRAAIAEAFERQHFRSLAVDAPALAAHAGSVCPDVAAVSLLSGEPALLELLRTWSDEPGRSAIPILAIVPADAVAAEAALQAGADDVLPWPAPDAFVRSRLRALVRLAIADRERRAFMELAQGLVRAHEARDPQRMEHSFRVSVIAAALARRAGLSELEASRVHEAGLLYDIGLLAVSDKVLFKDGPLTQDELAEIRSHPVIGYRLTMGIPSLELLRPFILRHHERIDGSGYPDGLRGREIPLPVQLVALADAYVALTSHRPQRPERSHDAALSILADEARRGVWDRELMAVLDGACRDAGG